MPKKGFSKITAEKANEIIDLHQKGLTIRGIAKAVGVDKSNVMKKIKLYRQGLPMVHPKLKTDEVVEILKANYGKVPANNLAKALGKPVNTMYRLYQELNLIKHPRVKEGIDIVFKGEAIHIECSLRQTNKKTGEPITYFTGVEKKKVRKPKQVVKKLKHSKSATEKNNIEKRLQETKVIPSFDQGCKVSLKLSDKLTILVNPEVLTNELEINRLKSKYNLL